MTVRSTVSTRSTITLPTNDPSVASEVARGASKREAGKGWAKLAGVVGLGVLAWKTGDSAFTLVDAAQLGVGLAVADSAGRNFKVASSLGRLGRAITDGLTPTPLRDGGYRFDHDTFLLSR